LLVLSLFANLKAKIGQNGTKKLKILFYKCLKIPLSISSLGGSILTKKNQNRFTLHRKKKVREFPVPSRDVTTNSPWAGIMTS
jgi:hypothetical protein